MNASAIRFDGRKAGSESMMHIVSTLLLNFDEEAHTTEYLKGFLRTPGKRVPGVKNIKSKKR